MSRFNRLLAVAVLTLLALPTPAMAIDVLGEGTIPTLRIVISLVGLLVAAVLLVEAGRVRTVAWGGAIAEKIGNVVLAILCLAASALARWTQNFVEGVTLEQVQIASEVLVIVAMVLLGIYFASVRRALHGFLASMTGEEKLAAEESEAAAQSSENTAERD